MIARLQSLWRDRQGVAMVEMALMLPGFLLIILGGFEVARFVIANQKASGLAALSADLVAQVDGGAIQESELADLFAAAPNVTTPFNFTDSGRVVISSVIGTGDGNNRILWQRCSDMPAAADNPLFNTGTTPPPFTSWIGSEGAENVPLPANLALADGQNAIVAESYLVWRPLVAPDVVPSQVLRFVTILRNRYESILVVEDDIAPQTC